MSETQANKQATSGSILKAAVILLLRNWLLLIGTFVVLGLISLGSLYLGGHCFSAARQGCAPAWIFAALGRQGPNTPFNVASYIAEFGFDIALAVSLLWLYAKTVVDPRHPPYVLHSARRKLRFFGRVVIYWIFVHGPYLLLQSAYAGVADRIASPQPDATTGFLLWLGWATLATLLLTYVHVRLTFYLASAAYGSNPAGFLACWRSTRMVTGRLMLAYLAIEILSRALYFVGYLIQPLIPNLDQIAGDVFLWALILLFDPASSLVDVAIAALDAVLTTLFCAAVSIIAYREIVIVTERTPDIFD